MKASVGWLVIATLPLVAACEMFDPTLPILTSEPDESGLAPASVDLPAVPPLELLDMPAQHPDGSWSVSGLLLNRDALRDSEITLTAIVKTIYQCDAPVVGVEGELAELAAGTGGAAPTAAGGEAAPRPNRFRTGCRMPHMHVVDNLRADYAMLIVGYDADFYETQMRPGGRYVFSGRYAQQSSGFMSTEEGLVVARVIDGEGIVHPPEPGEEGVVEEPAPTRPRR